MSFNLKSSLSIFFSSWLLISVCDSQTIFSDDDSLNLNDSNLEIENSINLNITNSDYEYIKASRGQKISVRPISLIINGKILDPAEIRTRGQSTLYFRRKSYSFNLHSNASFVHREKSTSLKKFYVLSLSMDKNYRSNRLAFEMMENSQLFGLFYAFCELRINGQSEGICMVIERPEDWALKKRDSPLVIRRGYNGTIDNIKTGKSDDREQLKEYKSYFGNIYRSLNRFHGEELYNSISSWLDLEVYMKWLAFNYFVHNGDYTDEVYFYVEPATEKFSIIPWDYDDLFSSAPHEGNFGGRRYLNDKLFFSTEDMLDKKIVTDPYLYSVYLNQFEELINQLSPQVLKRIFENTYAELYPYYKNSDIISKSDYDLYKGDTLLKLRSDLLSVYNQLLISRNIYFQYLESYKK